MNQNRMATLGLAMCLGITGLAGFTDPARAQDNKPIEIPVADLAEANKAQQALEDFIRAYEAGNIGLIRSKLDPGMIGYQRFIDGMVQDTNQLKQIRLHLLDTQTMAGPDVAIIQTSWEKRFLSTGLSPGLYTGKSQFLLHRGKDGWRVAAVGGDDPFSSQSGVLAQLALTNASLPLAPAVSVEVIDPDLAGKGSISVQLSYGASTILVVLTESTPGRFGTTQSVTSGTVTMRYMDGNPGGGRPPSLLTRSIVIP